MKQSKGTPKSENVSRDRKSRAEPESSNTSPTYSTPPAQFDPLRRYLWEINQYKLLTPEEEKDLATRYYEKRDMDAAYGLITANLRLVVKIALDFQRYWMQNLLDLIQEGNIGLMQAVKKFDP
ncbi:MAG: RNA polymerase subunit sigma-70, partial [Deltaproteobacteria bacterium]|nr:RNA polymerase subunit sigma-70 [Deltaproteobacteria bacterium]